LFVLIVHLSYIFRTFVLSSNIHVMANVRFQYRSKKDRAYIEVRFSYKINDKWISKGTRTNIDVSKTFWKDYKAGKNFRDTDKANRKTEIDKHFNDLKKFLLQKFDTIDTVSKDWLKNTVYEYYHPKKEKVIPDDLLAYWDYYLELRKAEIPPKSRSYQKWIEIKRKVARFQKAKHKRYKIKDVNDNFKAKWADWCENEKYAPSTTTKNLSYIKMLCTHAGTKGIETSRDLAKLSAKIKEKKKPKVYLSFNELEQIKALNDLPGYLDNARDWLLISCYTGQRISDFMRFSPSMIRKSKGKQFLDLTQQKTGKDVTVPLIPETLEVLNKRDGNFPRKISDQRYNDYIKEVCKRAGITNKMYGKKTFVIEGKGKRDIPATYEKWELIGSHVGRRSFATNYYGKLPTSYLKNITGHSTEAMLLKYIGKTSNDTAFEAYDLMVG